MPEYELRLRFTAADGSQASRLAEAWAGTCAAEYGTTYAGLWLAVGRQPSTHPVDLCTATGAGLDNVPLACELADGHAGQHHDPITSADWTAAVACEWCGRAIRQVDGAWRAVKADERGYDALDCEGADTARHNPPASST